ncbi:DUF5704 domain-containing protein [[Clostridium] polysaccharolyticum]|nr:DUF5704 domain-containing protein [[Clostridium] polysaccharolyticum]
MIYFETADTKATSGVRWKTIGFTITRERCLTGKYSNGGYPLKLRHAVVLLNDEWKKERVSDIGVEVTFTIPQSVVSRALIRAGMDDLQHDDILYLHGIFQVTHNGKDYGGKKYSLPDIMSAESWANPDDFRDRFDVKVIYKAADEPISIQYKTSAGDIIETSTYPLTKWEKPGTSISVSLAEQKIYQGKKYVLYKSYIRSYLTQKAISGYGASTLKGDSLYKVQNRKINQQIGGVQFVAIMKLLKEPKVESEQSVESEWDEPLPKGIIAADNRGSPVYDVEAGIPAAESLYLNVFSKNYLLGYKYENQVGTKEYEITFTKTYHLQWTELTYNADMDVVYKPMNQTKTITKTVKVKRRYSYWNLTGLEFYIIRDAIIKNDALPDGSVVLTPKEYIVPELNIQKYQSALEHVKDPSYTEHVTLPSETIDGGNTCPELPVENFETLGEDKIGKIKVRNDGVELGGVRISSDSWEEEKTEKPRKYDGSSEIGENTLYKSGVIIPKETANDIYETSGIITYQIWKKIGEVTQETIFLGIEEFTDVRVHTPTVCDASISDDRAHNQMLEPDRTRTSLVLDRKFEVFMPTEGEHLPIRGYGLRDYGKFIEERQVRFPFDVYRGQSCYRADSWITITGYSEEFYLPIWVREGKYTIECRARSISTCANHGEDKEEELANLQLDNYVATCQIAVEVSGRLYGFQLTDISDYPLWHSVFRKKDSLVHSGFRYFTGDKNQNGLRRSDRRVFTVPLVKGSHPTDSQAGITSTGYTFRFTLETIGKQEYVQIKPSFYFVPEGDRRQRQEADVYYMETIEEKKHAFVKVGSELDLQNIKNRYLGNPYLSVPKEEIEEKERLTGKTENELLYQLSPMFTFHHLLLSAAFRTYTGKNYTPNGKIPDWVEEKEVAKSKQKWYGEYYLPSQTYVVPKDLDLDKMEQNYGSFNMREDFWLKRGYLMVQFDIVTIKNEKRFLSYVNQENARSGYCNMWHNEGFFYEKKDSDGVRWTFQDGDCFLYDLRKGAGKEYFAGGTH